MTAESVRSIPTVLIVDDDREVAERYSGYLRDSYEVRTAHGGEAALEQLEDDVDVLLLDRRMPNVSGTEVLAEVGEHDVDVRVALLADEEPDFDAVDLPVDDCLVRPVTREEIRDAVDGLRTLAEYERRREELNELRLARNVLEVEKTEAELRDSRRFTELNEEIVALEATVEGLAEDLDDGSVDFGG